MRGWEIRHFIEVRTMRADGGTALVRVDNIDAIIEGRDNKGKDILILQTKNSNPLRVVGETIETIMSKMSQAAAKDFTIIRNPDAEAAKSLARLEPIE